MTDTEAVACPTSGTFRTSWRAQITNAGWGAVAIPVLGVILWLSGAPIDRVILLFLYGFGAAAVLWTLLLYPIRGVAEVCIDPEAVTVTTHSGLERRIERADLLGAWFEKRWVLKTRDQKVTIWDEGFEFDDWSALSGMLHDWKVKGGQGPIPGVVPLEGTGGGGPETVVFEAYRPVVPLIGMASFAVFLLGAGAMSWPDDRGGSWSEDPMITVGFPLLGLVFVALLVRGLRTTVRRAFFLPEAVRFERLIGPDQTVRYRDVIDALGPHVDTPVGTFYLGRRNDDVFGRLLGERLEDEQLTGRRWLASVLWLQPRVWLVSAAGAVAVWAVISRLGPRWGVNEAWGEFLVVVALVGYGLLLWAGGTLWSHRMLRDARD